VDPIACEADATGCLARVDGVPDVMTCMTPVRGGESVEPQNIVGSIAIDPLALADRLFPHGFDHNRFLTGMPGAASLLSTMVRRVGGIARLPSAEAPPHAVTRLQHEVVVIGAGPSGIAVASQLCRLGLEPLVIDEGPLPTGSLLALGLEARDAFVSRNPIEGARRMTQACVAGIFDRELLVVRSDLTSLVNARAIVIAVGAHDVGRASLTTTFQASFQPAPWHAWPRAESARRRASSRPAPDPFARNRTPARLACVHRESETR